MKARLDRGGLDVEHLGRLRDAELLDAAQHEDLPKLLGQPIDRRLHDSQQVVARCRVLGLDLNEVGQREHVLLGLDDLGRAAHAAERFVDGDAREPGLEAVRAAKLVEVVVGANVRGLHDVARLVVVAHDAAREAEQQAVVPPHQELEERGIAGQHARDDRGVGDRGVGAR